MGESMLRNAISDLVRQIEELSPSYSPKSPTNSISSPTLRSPSPDSSLASCYLWTKDDQSDEDHSDSSHGEQRDESTLVYNRRRRIESSTGNEGSNKKRKLNNCGFLSNYSFIE